MSNERPGVYSYCTVSSSLTSASRGAVIGIAACALTGSALTVSSIDSWNDAVSLFGENSNLARLIKVLFRNGAASVRAVPAAVGENPSPSVQDYSSAFQSLITDPNIRIMICDSRAADVHSAMRSLITLNAPEGSQHRFGIVETDGDNDALILAAQAQNSERIVLCSPVETGDDAVPGSVAAAVAGAVSATQDPAVPMNGVELQGIGTLSRSLSESDLNALIPAGITPIETVSGRHYIVRAVTSRTTTNGADDPTWRELTTVRIIDDVIPAVRDALRARFLRAKNTAQTRGAIRTQVAIELEAKKSAEIIDDYSNITVAASESDPTCCIVSFDFTVAHGLNQIHITAYITV
ncbi:MAG: phage tail sheath subtilisin-like domain-containing protein [Eubacteriales bacterium]|nr:phage tail sheath subtilisin-like domain-containing protein [Eubacteriales bacterium]